MTKVDKKELTPGTSGTLGTLNYLLLQEWDNKRVSKRLPFPGLNAGNNYANYFQGPQYHNNWNTYYYEAKRNSENNIKQHGQLEVQCRSSVSVNPGRVIPLGQPAYEWTNNSSKRKKEPGKCRKVT